MSALLPNIRRGGEGAEEAAKSGGKFARLNYFQLEENKTTVLRFLTDSPNWWYVKQHPSVPTKNQPADYKGNWPAQMPAVCRHDDAFQGIYNDCYICDTPIMNPRDNSKPLKAALRVWALAVEREAVIEGGVTKGYRSVIEEIPERNDKGEETGKTIKQPKIVVVNMGMKNFFSGLQGIFGLFQTVCGTDMLVRRTGSGLDTDYQIIPLPEISTLKGPIYQKQGDDVVKVAEGTESFTKLEKAVEAQGIDLLHVIAERASDDYYGRFFDPSKTVASTNGGGNTSAPATTQSAPAAQQAAPSSDVVDPAKLQAMKDRVRGTGANAAPAAEAPVETPVETPQEAAPAPEPVAAAAATGPVDYDA